MNRAQTRPWADLISPEQDRFATSPYGPKTLAMLDVMVPFEILTQRRLGPEQRIRYGQEAWWAVLHCEGKGQEQTSGGAALMYGGPTYRRELVGLVRALAALAYQPGGVDFCGRHWCADHQQCLAAEQDTPGEPQPTEPSGPTFHGRPLETITPAAGQVL